MPNITQHDNLLINLIALFFLEGNYLLVRLRFLFYFLFSFSALMIAVFSMFMFESVPVPNLLFYSGLMVPGALFYSLAQRRTKVRKVRLLYALASSALLIAAEIIFIFLEPNSAGKAYIFLFWSTVIGINTLAILLFEFVKNKYFYWAIICAGIFLFLFNLYWVKMHGFGEPFPFASFANRFNIIRLL